MREGMQAGADDYLGKPMKALDLELRLIAAQRVTKLHRDMERLAVELAASARQDSLTGLGNRLRMQEDLDSFAAQPVRAGQGPSIALVDVDNFKKINDTRGHPAGDRALQAIAQILKQANRTGDLTYRFGGDEFLVIFPQVHAREAKIAMERTRWAVAEIHDVGGVTELLRAADSALYRAKAALRNERSVANERPQ